MSIVNEHFDPAGGADQAAVSWEMRGEGLHVRASGTWTIATVGTLDAKIRKARELNEARRVIVDAVDIVHVDTAGAWLLRRLVRTAEENGGGGDVVNLDARFERLLALAGHVGQPDRIAPPPRLFIVKLLEEIGEGAFHAYRQGRDLLGFIGLVTVKLMHVIVNPRRIRGTALVNQIEEVGLNALPIVGLLNLLVGVVLAYQGADQLARFGAEIFTVNLLAVSVLREIGVLITSIIVAGRSGSAFTAQIGTMKVNQEIDAMQTIGLDPIEVLVVPRMIALIIALPLLTFFAMIMGLFGGGLVSVLLLDLSVTQFTTQLLDAATIETMLVGLVKAPVFASLIALVGCFEGLRVSGSADSVGRLTTQSVVESIFLVIVFDAAFSIVFSILGI
ncbi:MAG: MlaE family lipid ABC transporter permease subunit [Alphaproteobacteria bacterium]|nr:MlaE family lipid ABC transporter permease subunit [Alphaproteobacteria bacterium]